MAEASAFIWRGEWFEELRVVAARCEAEWPLFARACREREKGLRKQSLATMTAFISDMLGKPLDERIRFTKLVRRPAHVYSNAMLVPQPLWARVIEPTLREWAAAHTTDPTPLVLLGGEANIRQALARAPDDPGALSSAARHCLDHPGFAIHHMPDCFVGEVSDVEADLAEAKALISRLPEGSERASLLQDVREVEANLGAYTSWLAAGAPGLLRDWCAAAGLLDATGRLVTPAS